MNAEWICVDIHRKQIHHCILSKMYISIKHNPLYIEILTSKLCTPALIPTPYLHIFLLSQHTIFRLFLLSFSVSPSFLFFYTPPSLCNKSDKIRDCISPLSSPSLKRVSCLRRGVPDIAHQTFVTFQWASYFSPPHLGRHQPFIDRLWIREVEGGTVGFQQIVAICVCCYPQCGALWDKRLRRQ